MKDYYHYYSFIIITNNQYQIQYKSLFSIFTFLTANRSLLQIELYVIRKLEVFFRFSLTFFLPSANLLVCQWGTMLNSPEL